LSEESVVMSEDLFGRMKVVVMSDVFRFEGQSAATL
jgi:hypothetical protein